MKNQKITPATKAGKLANGFERGKGTIVHAVQSVAPYVERALCGSAPKIQWIAREGASVTCQKCLKKLGPHSLGAALVFVFLVLFAPFSHAEQAAECKEAVRAFNKAHTPAEIGVYIHDGQVDAVIATPKAHKLGSAGLAAVTSALRVCVSTGAFSNVVYGLDKGESKATRACHVTNTTKMLMSCTPGGNPITFKAVK